MDRGARRGRAARHRLRALSGRAAQTGPLARRRARTAAAVRFRGDRAQDAGAGAVRRREQRGRAHARLQQAGRGLRVRSIGHRHGQLRIRVRVSGAADDRVLRRVHGAALSRGRDAVRDRPLRAPARAHARHERCGEPLDRGRRVRRSDRSAARDPAVHRRADSLGADGLHDRGLRDDRRRRARGLRADARGRTCRTSPGT